MVKHMNGVTGTPVPTPILGEWSRGVILTILVVILSGISAFGYPGRASANGISDWSDPIDLANGSDFGTPSMIPRMAADRQGNVHVIWGAWIGPDPAPNQAPNAIVYARSDGGNWTKPIDILAAPGAKQTLQIYSVATSVAGDIIIAWSVGDNILVSKAPIEQATDPRAWKTANAASCPSCSSARLSLDPTKNRWYLAYVDRFASVMLTYSDNDGDLWAPPKEIWSAVSAVSAPNNIDMVVTQEGSAIIAWSESTSESNWSSEAIWRARVTGDNNLSVAVTEVARSANDDPTMDWPILTAGPDGAVHLFWNNEVNSATGRFHQWSTDNGASWSRVEQIFPEDLSGQTGQAGMTLDSSGRLQVVTSAKGKDGNDLVLRYATWKDGAWTPYISLWASPLVEGEHPSLATTGGNRLHLVWRDETHNIVAYSSRVIDAPALPAQEFVISETKPEQAIMPQPTSSATSSPEPQPTDLVRQSSLAGASSLTQAGQPLSPLMILALSSVPVLGLLGVVFVLRIRSRGSHR